MNSVQLDLPALIVSSSQEETFDLGRQISQILVEGSVVALKGPLGAGKTCMAKGIARGLGVEEEVTSPSYTIVSEYDGAIADKNNPNKKLPVHLYHIDAFRLGGNKDFSDIGGEEIIFGNGISVIEWSENIPAFIPGDAIKVEIDIREDDKRNIRLYRGLRKE
jgi:tRNA threonylcarbamoyladenosine biosynthesis protein TsaE